MNVHFVNCIHIAIAKEFLKFMYMFSLLYKQLKLTTFSIFACFSSLNKMSLPLILLVVLVSQCLPIDCRPVIITVPENGTLQEVLCGNSSLSHTTVVLRAGHGVAHNLSTMCSISNTISLTLKSNSTEVPALITCHQNASSQLKSGLSFTDNNNLTIRGIHFEHCGGPPLTGDDLLSTIYIKDCRNMLLVSLVFHGSYGFAIFAHNVLGEAHITSTSVQYSNVVDHKEKKQAKFSGSGLLFLYSDGNDTQIVDEQPPTNLVITDLFITHNRQYSRHVQCLGDVGMPAILYGIGLTVVYNQSTFNTCTTILKGVFAENYGQNVGSVHLLHLNTLALAQTTIREAIFKNNYNQNCRGSALSIFSSVQNEGNGLPGKYTVSVLKVVDTIFESQHLNWAHTKQSRAKKHSAVYIVAVTPKQSKLIITFKNTTFTNITVTEAGSCLYAEGYDSLRYLSGRVVANLIDVNVSHNLQSQLNRTTSTTSCLLFRRIHRVNVYGTRTVFLGNLVTALEADNSDVHLLGRMNFTGNHANTGGVLRLHDSSKLHFGKHLQAFFINNSAKFKGGAIYAVNEGAHSCVLQLNYNLSAHAKPRVVFQGNRAGLAGGSVYADPLYDCKAHDNYMSIPLPSLYNIAFHFHSNKNSSVNSMSTAPLRLVPCDGSVPQLNMSFTQNKVTYPGKTLNYSVAAVDSNNMSAYTILYLNYVPKGSHDWETGVNIDESIHEVHEGQCTVIKTIIHTGGNNYSQCSAKGCQGNIVYSFLERAAGKFPITIHQCPIGFQLNDSSRSCRCADVLVNKQVLWGTVIDCDINKLRIKRPPFSSPWMGNVSEKQGNTKNTVFGVSFSCPIGYCNNNVDSYYYPNKAFCVSHRSGVMCGKCLSKYSIVFGSRDCRECSNWWLLTLPGYALVGLFIIFIFFKLKLTLSLGTINAFLFLASFQNTGMNDILNTNGLLWSNQCEIYYSRFISIVMAFMNLELGFPLCLYNGMDEVWKTGLQLAFPLYLFIVIALLCIISRYSVAISNQISKSTIKVLVTVVHITFSRLLVTVIDVFGVSVVYTNNQTHFVWRLDGTVDYFDKRHVILMVMGSLIIILCVLPYILFLACRRLLVKISCIRSTILPLYEAILAPYKPNKQYWFVLRLLVVVVWYFLYIVLRGTYFIFIYTIGGTVVMVFSILHAHARPFKSNIINILDAWLMTILVTILNTTWLFIMLQAIEYSAIIVNVCITLVLVTMAVVIVFHVLWVSGKLKIVQQKLSLTNAFSSLHKSYYGYQLIDEPTDSCEVIHVPVNKNKDYEASQLREPLLSPT